MLAGTGSDVGKSILAAAFCRILKQDGYHPAPFKAQNMALNSYATPEGLEIGRAQAVQAEAAGVPCHTDMNPLLLKPSSEHTSQVVLLGKPIGDRNAYEYFRKEGREELRKVVNESYNRLATRYNPIVMEGAGSISEINLRDVDLVNMPMAKHAGADVFLVADIDRGGVFASVYGSILLQTPEERSLIKGIIINKFRGDIRLFESGIKMIEDLCKVPVLGVVPYYKGIYIEEEDSVMLESKNREAIAGKINIAVILLRHLSNFTDFNVFECIDGVSVRYVNNVSEIGNPDMIILPGSKNTVADLLWMRENGIETAVKKSKCPIFGICGGYQMLGEKITDTDGVENDGSVRGMGLLPMETEFKTEKTRTIVNGVFENMTGTLKSLNGTEFEGYEIHMGKSEFSVPYMTKLSNGKQDGISQGDVHGSYVHGIFDKCADKIVKCLCDKKGIDSTKIKSIDMAELKEREYDRLADMVRESLDMDLIYKIINKEV